MATAAQTTNTAKTVATVWPGGFGIYNTSKEAVKLNLKTILMLIVISFGASIALSILTSIATAATPDGVTGLFEFIFNVASYGVSFVIGIMSTIVLLKSVKGESISVKEAFDKSLPLLLTYFVLSFLTFGAIALSLILFIIPVFFVAPRLALAQYYLIDKNMDPMDAFKASWNETKGNVAKVYGIIGAGIVMFLPVFTLIGIPVAIYLLFMYQAALAVLYMHIQKTPKTA